MTWGIPTGLFLEIHVALSLIALVTGLIVLFGLLSSKALGGWTALILLAIAVLAIYAFHLAGAWRWIYVVTATAALYLDAFVAVIQAFGKVPFLQALAPNQTEPPFLIAQVVVLAFFVVLGVLAVRKFHPHQA
jgi:hypothetical protein